MSSDDQFTSIQWDREDIDNHDQHQDDVDNDTENKTSINPIAEEGSLESDHPSDSKTTTTSATGDDGEPQDHDTSKDDTTGSETVADTLEATHLNDDHDSNHNQSQDNDNTKSNNNDNSKAGSSDSSNGSAEQPSDSLLLSPTKQEPKSAHEESASGEPTPAVSPTSSSNNNNQTNEASQLEQQSSQGAGQADEELPPAPKGYVDISYYDKYAIKTSVTHPNRDLDAASKPFISYLVTTTTNNPSILKLTKEKKPKDGEDYLTFSVRRRYGDFRYLYESLSNDFPTVMIPPLPSKLNFKYLTGDTFSSEFVHKRLHSLDRFVRFILQHKILSQLSIFHLFVSDSNDWATFTASLKIKDSGEDSGFVGKVVNEDLITETVMNFLTPSKHKKETNRDILEINDKLKKLYENLLKLDKIFSKLNKKNHELSVDYELFLNQIVKLSTREDEEAIDSNYKIFAQCLTEFSKSWDSLYRFYNETFIVALKDSGKYIMSLTNLIQIQHNKQIDLQVLHDYLNKTKAELLSLGGNINHGPPPSPHPQLQSSGGIVNNTTQLIKDTLSTSATPHIGSTSSDNKIQKLENKIQELNKEIRKESELLTELINQIVVEFGNLQNFIKLELKNSMISLCDQNISFYQLLLQKYEELEMKLMKRLDDNSL
ncbi:Sorting nexin-4 [Candida viswanathii]|uniref:Sorting nexin-4 n=1 Tax=Candida viswanathii TaxID=5486 RepID=A0A367YLU7_9ASCO|nr:Sorting nexin-4 [Candida viswanathii]